MKTIDGFTHEWKFDPPWHMVDLRDWFYMVNVGGISPIMFLHVRILGLRSVWTFESRTESDKQMSKWLEEVMLKHG